MNEQALIYVFSTVFLTMAGYLIGAGRIKLNFASILLLLAVLAFPIVINVAGLIYSGSAPETEIPDVLGMKTTQALEKLEGANLKGEIIGLSVSKSPPGTVISQQPEAGKIVKTGRQIKLIISAKESVVTVPGLVGRSTEEAVSILTGMGLNIERIYEVPSDEAAGIIIEQFPLSGELASPGAAVRLTVSLGKASND